MLGKSTEEHCEKRGGWEEKAVQGWGGDSWRGLTPTKPLPQGWAKQGRASRSSVSLPSTPPQQPLHRMRVGSVILLTEQQ